MFSSRVRFAAQKISPELERELRRHVARSTPKQTSKQAGAESQTNSSSSFSTPGGKVLAGCLALTGFALSMPAISMWWIGGLVQKDEALTAAQTRRGAFMNSGTRDAGKDPNWNFSNGTYKKDKKYQELFERDDPNNLDHGEEFFKRK
mmetsp:Transcript_5611/g.8176  ORF Transcript_5611/g.8176 Transcript_5611/m.8176 type:complete len:148 (-) Transcript_5611:205-648(-)